MKLETFRALAKSELHVDWIVEGLISPGGWTFLVGEPKIGKSILMIQLCEALQKGEAFLGLKTTRHNCLYIQSDAGLLEWYEQVRRIAGESYAWTVHQLDPGFLDEESERQRLSEIVWGDYSIEVQGEQGYKQLTAVLEGRPFTFVVFDCLHTITNGDINTKSACNQVRSHINHIVCRQNKGGETLQVPYVLIHHPNASQKVGVTSGSGWKGLSGDCTTKINLLPEMLRLEGSKLTGYREILLERDSRGAWVLPTGGGYQSFLQDMEWALQKRRNHERV